MKSLLLTIFLVVTVPAVACVNEGDSFDESYEVKAGPSPMKFLRERMIEGPKQILGGLPGAPPHLPGTEVDFKNMERNGVRDIYSGNYSAAIEKFLTLEAAHPGHYNTAANLGTAYELLGDNKNALHWITEGMKRNEDSHQGTEWLHKQILETKIAMESDPDHLTTTHILAISQSHVPWQPHHVVHQYDGRSFDVAALMSALRYQLGERMLFVKPRDPVVADLLYSFAILEANTQKLGPALDLLQLAEEYGYHNEAELSETRDKYQMSLYAEKLGQGTKAVSRVAMLCIGAALLCLLARAIVRRMDLVVDPEGAAGR